jgi:prolyl oligopeptidase
MVDILPDQSPNQRVLRSRTFLHRVGNNLTGEGDKAIFGFDVDAAVKVEEHYVNTVLIPAASSFALGVNWTLDTDLRGLYLAPTDDLTSQNVHWKRIVQPEDQVQTIATFVIHGSDLYLISHKDAPRARVIRLDLTNPEMSNAAHVVEQSNVVIEDIAGASDGLYIMDLDGGISRLRRLKWGESTVQDVRLPFKGAIRQLVTSPNSPGAYLRIRSRTHANAIWHVDADLGDTADTGWQSSAKADFSNIDEREVMVTSYDGTRVPLSILIAKGLPLDHRHPTLLDSYGAYGVYGTAKPWFDPTLLAWLERGGVFAVAHPRGGGEFGEEWRQFGDRQFQPREDNERQ